MKYLFIPTAITIVVMLLTVYFSAAILGGIFGTVADFFEWLMDGADRVIRKLEAWGDQL